MHKALESYYRTERISSAFLSFVGAGSATAGLLYYLYKGSPFSTGLMLGLCLIGTYQIVIGVTRILRSRRRFKQGLDHIEGKNTYLRTSEYPRILQKEQTMKKVRYIELGTIISCMIILVFFLIFPFSKSALGTLVGLLFHGAFLFAFDLFSQFRLQEYIHQLKKYLSAS